MGAGQTIATITAAASKAPWLLQMMDVVGPEGRASAAQILVGKFEAGGLTTPRGNIAPLMPRAVPDQVHWPHDLVPVPRTNERGATAGFEYGVAGDCNFENSVREAFAATVAEERCFSDSMRKSFYGGIRK